MAAGKQPHLWALGFKQTLRDIARKHSHGIRSGSRTALSPPDSASVDHASPHCRLQQQQARSAKGVPPHLRGPWLLLSQASPHLQKHLCPLKLHAV